jgi:hypothetical protein
MPVKRRTSKLRAVRITEAALAAFERLRWLEEHCSCPPRDWDDWPGKIPNNQDRAHWERWYRRCAACEEWSVQHEILHSELGMKPWQWPCVESPATRNPWPEGSYKHGRWGPDLEAQSLWRELEAALAARRSFC